VTGYLKWIAVFAVFFMVSYNMEIYVKTDGSPQLQMIGVSSCGLVNLVLDYIFVIIFHWGVEGAAAATGIAQAVSALIFLCYFKFRSKTLRFQRIRPELSVYKRIVPLGLADSLTELSGGLVIVLFNRMILWIIGEDGLISYTVISYLNTLALNCMAGIAQGAQPLISFHYGAGQRKSCSRLLKYGLCFSAVFGLFFFGLSELAPGLPMRLFLGNAETALIRQGTAALRLYGISFAFVGFNVVLAGFFTAMDRPSHSLTISLSRSLFLLSACLIVMAVVFGERGIWLSTAVSEGLCLFISGFLFFRYRKSTENAA